LTKAKKRRGYRPVKKKHLLQQWAHVQWLFGGKKREGDALWLIKRRNTRKGGEEAKVGKKPNTPAERESHKRGQGGATRTRRERVKRGGNRGKEAAKE